MLLVDEAGKGRVPLTNRARSAGPLVDGATRCRAPLADGPQQAGPLVDGMVRDLTSLAEGPGLMVSCPMRKPDVGSLWLMGPWVSEAPGRRDCQVSGPSVDGPVGQTALRRQASVRRPSHQWAQVRGPTMNGHELGPSNTGPGAHG